MGSATVQGKLWGTNPRTWADIAEPLMAPMHAAAITALGPLTGLTLLDAGCGTGYALELAAAAGARVSGSMASGASRPSARPRPCSPASGRRPPPGTPAPLAVASPGVVEDVLGAAGLQVTGGAEVDCPFGYPDIETAWRRHGAGGFAEQAVAVAREVGAGAELAHALNTLDRRGHAGSPRLPRATIRTDPVLLLMTVRGEGPRTPCALTTSSCPAACTAPPTP